jgi:hypothetical protein
MSHQEADDAVAVLSIHVIHYARTKKRTFGGGTA